MASRSSNAHAPRQYTPMRNQILRDRLLFTGAVSVMGASCAKDRPNSTYLSSGLAGISAARDVAFPGSTANRSFGPASE
jgi:hypothetical protein